MTIKMSDQWGRENLQRVGPLCMIPELLQRLGAKSAEVLAVAGLRPEALDNPEDTISYAAMGRLLKVAAEKTECPHFGLFLGEQIGIKSLGLIGELMRNAPTVGAALVDFTTHQHRNAHGSVVYLLPAQHQVFFGYAVYQQNVDGNQVICDAMARGGVNVLNELAHLGQAPAIEVLLSRSEPMDVGLYKRSFGVDLRFNAEQTAILFSAKLLERTVAGADAKLRLVLEKRVEALWRAGELDTVTKLRRMLRVALLSRETSAGQIAERLGMSRRTLNRRLEVQGLRFQEVLDETRSEFARQLLAYTSLNIADIGEIVGYTDPSAFTRGFSRWAGVPPSEWRVKIEIKV